MVSPAGRNPVQVEVLTQSLFRRKSLDYDLAPLRPHPSTPLRVLREVPDPVGKLRIVVRREEKARSTIVDELRDPAPPAPDHREPACEGLEIHKVDGFGTEGVGETRQSAPCM